MEPRFGYTIWVRDETKHALHPVYLKMSCDCGWKDQCFSAEKLSSVILHHVNVSHDGNGKYTYNQKLVRIEDGIIEDENTPSQLAFIFEEDNNATAGEADLDGRRTA